MERFVLVHYSEIALKGKNREFFERKLIRNIKEALNCKVVRLYGRLLVKSNLSEEEIKEKLCFIPGVANFSFCYRVANDIQKIKKAALDIAKNSREENFRISAKKSAKFEYSAKEINEIVGEEVRTKAKKKVNLSKPEFTIYIEVTEKGSLVYRDKFTGIGGLPISSSGKVISLISGGIDSPVATFLMMKRGCEIVALHFYNETLSTPEKIKELIKILERSQPKIKLYTIPFGEIQKEIIAKINSRYRMLIYRRVMAKIAERIAIKERAKAIVTGDSLGQVASQTLENMKVIDEATALPILRPLIGFNKQEIVDLAKKIGTYKISIKPYQDCCSFMVAKHPETRAKIEVIKKAEKELDKKKLIENALNSTINSS